MQVTIDGAPYAPVCNSAARIGIGIITHNRADVLKRALAQHHQFLPPGALVVDIDDGSKPAAVVSAEWATMVSIQSKAVMASPAACSVRSSAGGQLALSDGSSRRGGLPRGGALAGIG